MTALTTVWVFYSGIWYDNPTPALALIAVTFLFALWYATTFFRFPRRGSR